MIGFKNAGISIKIVGGYIAIGLFIASLFLMVLIDALEFGEVNVKSSEIQVSTLLASTNMVSAINHSLSSLSGWLVIHKDKFKLQRKKAWQDIDDAYARLNVLSQDWVNPEDIKRLSSIRSALDALQQVQKEVEQISDSDATTATGQLDSRVMPDAAEILDSLDGLIENQRKLTSNVAMVDENFRKIMIQVAVVVFISTIFATIVATFVTRMVVVPVARVAKGLRFIANGQLGKHWRVTNRDELGRMLENLNKMSTSISEVVADVVEGAASINESAKQISSGTMDLSQRTEEQASSLEETASSMEEMTSTVQQNADNANQANQLAQAARDQAEAGEVVVHDAVEAMAEINEASHKISDIIGVVEAIAFQTNLLALNAAVEAARAGESGRGFAVVAAEVRTLAGRSADAAKEIKMLIEDSLNKVKVGSELVDKSGETLAEILTDVKRVSDIVHEIAAASNEQSSGIAQVNKAVMQMDGMTQLNASLVEETAAASREMESRAEQLNERVSFFDLKGYQKVASKTVESSKIAHKQKSIRNVPAAVTKQSVSKIADSSDDGDWKDF